MLVRLKKKMIIEKKKKKKVFMGGAKVLCLCNLEKCLLLVLQVTTDTDSEYSISKQSFV